MHAITRPDRLSVILFLPDSSRPIKCHLLSPYPSSFDLSPVLHRDLPSLPIRILAQFHTSPCRTPPASISRTPPTPIFPRGACGGSRIAAPGADVPPRWNDKPGRPPGRARESARYGWTLMRAREGPSALACACGSASSPPSIPPLVGPQARRLKRVCTSPLLVGFTPQRGQKPAEREAQKEIAQGAHSGTRRRSPLSDAYKSAPRDVGDYCAQPAASARQRPHIRCDAAIPPLSLPFPPCRCSSKRSRWCLTPHFILPPQTDRTRSSRHASSESACELVNTGRVNGESRELACVTSVCVYGRGGAVLQFASTERRNGPLYGEKAILLWRFAQWRRPISELGDPAGGIGGLAMEVDRVQMRCGRPLVSADRKQVTLSLGLSAPGSPKTPCPIPPGYICPGACFTNRCPLAGA